MHYLKRQRSTLGVFFGCFVLCLVNGRAMPEVDCVAAPYMAWSVVRHGSYELQYYPDLQRYVGGHVQARPDGAWVSIRTPGSALTALPIIAPFAIFREQPFGLGGMNYLGKYAAATMVAGAAVFFFLICRRLLPRATFPATVLFVFGTCLYSVAGQALWMHSPAVLWVSVAFYLLTREDAESARNLYCAGFALGMAVLCRPTAAFFPIFTCAGFIWQRRVRSLSWVTLGGIIPAVMLVHYNYVNFGNFLLGGYEGQYWNQSPPFWLGLGGLLVAPSRGLFVYSPALLLAIYGAWLISRRHDELQSANRTLLLTWGAASIATVLYYARWFSWQGGWCFGPRFLIETMPALCLLFAVAYQHLQTRGARLAAGGLVVLSVLVQVVGVFGHRGYVDWQIRHDLADQGRCFFELRDTQIEAHLRALLNIRNDLPPQATISADQRAEPSSEQRR